MSYAVSEECFCTFHMMRQQNGFKWQNFWSVSHMALAGVDHFHISPGCGVQVVDKDSKPPRSAICKSAGVLILGRTSLSHLWILAHKSSIGFTSGLSTVPGTVRMLWCWKKSFVSLAVCGQALSCWNEWFWWWVKHRIVWGLQTVNVVKIYDANTPRLSNFLVWNIFCGTMCRCLLNKHTIRLLLSKLY